MSEAQILRCPSCREFIASDATTCRFCRRPLDPQTIKDGVSATQAENKRYRRNHYLKHMMTGLGLFALGASITAATLWAAFNSKSGGYYVVTWGFMLGGIGDLLYGLYGFVGEALTKKNSRREARFNGRPES